MSITSYIFWLFLIVSLLVYYVFPRKLQWVVLLVTSIFFFSFSGTVLRLGCIDILLSRGILFPDCLEHGSGGIRIDTCRELPFALVTARKRTSAGIAFPRQCPDCYFGNYRYCQWPYGSERNRRGRLGNVGRLDNPACCRCIGRNDFKKSEIEKTN